MKVKIFSLHYKENNVIIYKILFKVVKFTQSILLSERNTLMKYELNDNKITLFLENRLDSYNSPQVQKEVDGILSENPAEKIIIDCTNLEYIASAGLRILLTVGKQYKNISIINVSREVYEVFDMTGFSKMYEVRKAMREISVEGCKEIGSGFSSNVYRYDRETVVKVFSPRITLERIYSETESAKKSFVAGIPTAIPYDVVRCGDCYGTVFELIDADTLSQNFMDHPERFDELMEKYVALLKKFHSTPAIEDGFPDIRDKYHTWAQGLKKYMDDSEIETILRLIDAVPYRATMIHVDCHSRNIMVQDGKLLFVDMADVSIGHPLFDIGAEYFHYMILRRTSLGAKLIFGVEPEDSELPVRVWYDLVRRYFDGFDEKKLEETHKMLKYFGCLRCMIMVAKHAHISREDALELIDMQRKELFPHIEEAAELFSRADEFFK